LPYCEFCGEQTGILPFKCNYCGGQFCGEHRLPEYHGCSLDVGYRKKRFIEKQKVRERHRRNRDLGVRGERSFIGSLVLYLVLITFSIIAYFYPYQMCLSYYSISYFSDSFIWTIFTSIFVIYFSNPFELAYFIILLVCSYYYIRTIENKYGPKLLLFIFVSCSVLGGLFNLFLSLFFPYYSLALILFPIGLASGGLLGLNLFLILGNSNKDWYFFKFKLKGKQLILFLVIINIVVKVITSIQVFADSFYFVIGFLFISMFVWYIFDLIGMIGAVIFYERYFKKRYYA